MVGQKIANSYRKNQKGLWQIMACCSCLLYACLLIKVDGIFHLPIEKEIRQERKYKQSSIKKSIHLEVPFINQNDDYPLENGCEVTSLAMVLNYHQIEVTKLDLYQAIDKVPLEQGIYRGDPHDGFVGNMEGGLDSMGVFVEPIAKVARQFTPKEMQVVASQSTPLSTLLQKVSQGSPIWTLVTINYQVPQEDDFFTWLTKNGYVEVTPLIHAVVIVGYDSEMVYINDPLTEANKKIPKKRFSAIFDKMGRQSLYLTPTLAKQVGRNE